MAVQSPYEGDIVLSWVIEEYQKHERGPLWYLVAFVVAGLFLFYAFVTQNFLFAVIILMFGVIIGLSALHEPRQLPFVITTLGIGVGEAFYPFKAFKSFWIIYEPPSKTLYLNFKKVPRPHLIVPIHETNPVEIRGTLMRYLEEEAAEEDEPLSDLLGRMLKL